MLAEKTPRAHAGERNAPQVQLLGGQHGVVSCRALASVHAEPSLLPGLARRPIAPPTPLGDALIAFGKPRRFLQALPVAGPRLPLHFNPLPLHINPLPTCRLLSVGRSVRGGCRV